MKRQLIAALIGCAAATLTAAVAAAQTPTRPAPPPNPHAGQNMPEQPGAKEPSPAQKYFSDVRLVDQDGRTLRFYTDMLKGKTVIVNAFFTTCTSVCPPMSRSLELVQEALGDRLGRNVFIFSISVDPLTDTPPRLKKYAQRFHAKPGWTFLTGSKENVEWALYKLGQYVQDKNDHTTIMIIGNEATGLWKKAFGMAKVSELIRLVNEVANDKGVPQAP